VGFDAIFKRGEGGSGVDKDVVPVVVEELYGSIGFFWTVVVV
jgi:hypothetical protein